jgi:hypothetical protein
VLAPLTDLEAQQAAKKVRRFIGNASIGDRTVVSDDQGNEQLKVRIMGAVKAEHVLLMTSYPSGFINDGPRFRGLLKNAYQQFMPDAVNVVVVTSAWASDVEDFETTLFHGGRGNAAFWSGDAHAESQAAVWFNFETRQDNGSFKVFARNNINPDVRSVMTDLFRTH